MASQISRGMAGESKPLKRTALSLKIGARQGRGQGDYHVGDGGRDASGSARACKRHMNIGDVIKNLWSPIPSNLDVVEGFDPIEGFMDVVAALHFAVIAERLSQPRRNRYEVADAITERHLAPFVIESAKDRP